MAGGLRGGEHEVAMRAVKPIRAGILALAAIAIAASGARADGALTLPQLVDAALEANPQVRAARARWSSAMHSIKQNYAPNDPLFNYFNTDSPTNGFDHAATHTINVADSFQFPGKALFQADVARRNAEAARLTYEAALRDIRAQVETGFYQDQLDTALGAVADETLVNLKRVLQVTQVAYSANQVTQTDFISAEFDLSAEQLERERLKVAAANDITSLNQLLNRMPDAPLALDRTLRLEPLDLRPDAVVERAFRMRQEILETALAQENSETRVTLAKMEYLPDYSLGYTFDNYMIPSAGPTLNSLQDHGWNVGFNIPVFFWIKQREDVTRAHYDLDAARYDLASIRSQTAGSVTTLYRSAQYAYQTAATYRDSLIPLARQNFEVALIAYTSGKIDFLTLATALRRSYDARIAYLTAANQYLAGRVAIEQAIGEPLSR
jgi:cobalt-zinc-cadmium efflux system outer membrane protein